MAHKVIIMGSGPAGLTAALYTARANMEPLVVEGDDAGGQLMITTDVENYPGFPDGILGPELIEVMRKQVERFGTKFLRGRVTKTELNARPFKIHIGDQVLETETFIIAAGARAKLIGLESEMKLMGHGVSACATCDGFFFKGKKVIVVGGGDTAMEEATFLTKFCEKVYIVHRRDKLRASKIMQDRAKKNEKIAFIWDSAVEEILSVEQNKVTAVKLKNVKTGEEKEMPIDGVFIAIGHEPNTHLFKGQLELNDGGFIKVHEPTTHTNIPGVFACGDVMDPRYKQAVTAAGTGCRAAIDAERWLEEQKG